MPASVVIPNWIPFVRICPVRNLAIMASPATVSTPVPRTKKKRETRLTPHPPLLGTTKTPRPKPRFNALPLHPSSHHPPHQHPPTLLLPPIRDQHPSRQLLKRRDALNLGPDTPRTHIRLAQRHQPAGLAHAHHLPHGVDRRVEVAEHLVRVHDVELAVRKGQPVDRRALERDVGRAEALLLGVGLRARQDVVCDLGRDDVAGGEEMLGEGGGDGAGSGADVEESQVWVFLEGGVEVREEVGGAVGGGAPDVVLDMGGRVADGVGGVGCHFWWLGAVFVVVGLRWGDGMQCSAVF